MPVLNLKNLESLDWQKQGKWLSRMDCMIISTRMHLKARKEELLREHPCCRHPQKLQHDHRQPNPVSLPRADHHLDMDHLHQADAQNRHQETTEVRHLRFQPVDHQAPDHQVHQKVAQEPLHLLPLPLQLVEEDRPHLQVEVQSRLHPELPSLELDSPLQTN